MKKIISAFLGLAAVAAFAVPSVSNVAVSFNETTRLVTVDYDLGEPAIVLARFYNGSTAIEPGAVKSLVGDVNRFVDKTTGCRLFWNAGADLPTTAFPANALKVEFRLYAKSSPPKFMVVDLAVRKSVRYYDTLAEVPGGLGKDSSDLNRTRFVVFRRIPAKGIQFAMGSPTTEARRNDNENRVLVTIPYDYYMSVYTITQAQHAQFDKGGDAGKYTGYEDSALYPLANYSYNMIRGSTDAGIDWPNTGTNVAPNSLLGKFRAYTGVAVDIPTEAEWEFAARGGYGSGLPDGRDFTQPGGFGGANEKEWGWVKQNISEVYGNPSPYHPGPVGQFKANRFDIYDVIGNPYECTRDWYVADRATLSGEALYKGPASGESRSHRAGTCFWNAEHARLAKRNGISASSGNDHAVRLVVPLN